jgi:dTDP-4-dehydrorhamnose 3,5-epimerase
MSALDKEAFIHNSAVIQLKRITNERGCLLEIQRQDDPHYPGFGQAYVTYTLPGVVKAWYRHHKQLDQIVLISGSVLLVMFDSREQSPTDGVLNELQLRFGKPQLVQIPPGVWHGFQALGTEPACLLHLNSVPIDLANKDEDRLPPDDPAIPYRWNA